MKLVFHVLPQKNGLNCSRFWEVVFGDRRPDNLSMGKPDATIIQIKVLLIAPAMSRLIIKLAAYILNR
jgi:hypothetical protein